MVSLSGNNTKVLLNSLRKETVAVEDLVTWFESHCEERAASHLVTGSVKI